MRKLVVAILFLLIMHQAALAQDKYMNPGLANIDKEAIIEFAKDVIAKKNPEINQEDLVFQAITYNYEPNVQFGRQESMSVRFNLKRSKLLKGGKITYQTINVSIDPNGDIFKSDVSSGSIMTNYKGHEFSVFWYFLDKYNTIIYSLSLLLWVYVFIVLYRRFHKSFIILFIASSIIAIPYFVLAKFAQSSPVLSLTTTASILYALGVTIEVVAIVLCIRFLKKSVT
jgi:hypothetical protein